MKRRTSAVLLLVVVIVIVAWVPVTRSLAWRRDYGQAEPLVQTVWPMAYEMKRFSEERGRPPNSLDELAAFSPDRDFTSFRSYPHEYHTMGPRRFFLRVNSRFAFVIDEHFTPTWWQPTNVLSPPTNPQ
jgi:hypothetical protein